MDSRAKSIFPAILLIGGILVGAPIGFYFARATSKNPLYDYPYPYATAKSKMRSDFIELSSMSYIESGNQKPDGLTVAESEDIRVALYTSSISSYNTEIQPILIEYKNSGIYSVGLAEFSSHFMDRAKEGVSIK